MSDVLLKLNLEMGKSIANARTHLQNWILFLLLFVWSVLLPACQAGSPPGPLPNGIPATAADDQRTRLSFAASRFSRQAYEDQIEVYHSIQEDFSVQFVPLDESAYFGPDAAAQLASAADSAAIYPILGETGYASYFLDLQPFIQADPGFDASIYFPGVSGACQADQRTVGLPVSISPNLIYYDSAAFEASGLDAPRAGWSWTDFINAVRVLAQEGEAGTYGFAANGDPLYLLAPLVTDSLDRNAGEVDAEAVAGAVAWYIELAGEGAVPPSPGEQDRLDRDRALIEEGRAAMWVDSLQNLSYWRSLLGERVAIAPFPISSQSDFREGNPAVVVCAGVSNGAPDRRAAWEWVKFLSSRSIEHQPYYLPASPQAMEASPTWQGLEQDEREAVGFALEHAWSGNRYNAILQAAGQAIQMALDGQSDLGQALTAAGSQSGAEEPATGVTPVVVNTPPPGNPAGAAARISYYGSSWVHFSPRGLDALAAEFQQAHPEIGLSVTSQLPVGPGMSIDMAGIAEQVDCFSWPFTPLEEWVHSFYSLDEFLIRSPTIRATDYDPSILDAFRIDGRLYGLPATSLPNVIYYHAERFIELGLDPPAIDWSFADFMLLAERLRGETAYGFVPYQGDYLGFLLAGRGVNWFDPERDPAILPLDSQEMLDALAWLVDLVEEGLIPPAFGEQAAAERERLVENGRAGMWNQYAFMTTETEEPVSSEYEIGIAPPPHLEGLLPAPVRAGLYISRQSQEPDVCWQWLSFLSQQPGAFSGVPARLPVLHSPEWERVFTPPGELFNLAPVYRAAATRPALEQNGDRFIRSWLEQAVQRSVLGEEPAATLAQAQGLVDRYQTCLQEAGFATLEGQLSCARQVDPTLPGP